MKIKRLDVINLEWSSKPNRDRQVTTLVCNYLRYMGYSVSEYSCFDNYVLSPQKNKNKFLKKYKKEGFQKIVGFGCWAFDFINPRHINHSFCEKFLGKKTTSSVKRGASVSLNVISF
jgi:hypothetical protein